MTSITGSTEAPTSVRDHLPGTAPGPREDAPPGGPPEARLTVEYWTVAMDGDDSCGSCDETLTTLRHMVARVRPLARSLGIDVDVTHRVVATWGEALDHEIVASPTIRAEGTELRPSHPDDSERREWRWRGDTGDTAPGQALLDLLVRALAVRSRRLSAHLDRRGPAPYVRQYLQPAPSAAEPTSSGNGPATCG
ncbi:DUF2703 domain-containing protein [Thermomonospora umbrina]|uniref:Uncharacterized protein DUF2703 n=1 Tax=Thermomonospora umbrina TaxID=111806 RepID=A0A3D9SWL5_9ACTN|nr:DUF2703 domain-containing protein [Thermomonospora umbrina]REE99987.1 uncharacterized protein DUF2703 [Thermomonospora umbrina]